MIPNLQHVSIDVCSDTFNEENEDNSENEDTDFDIQECDDSEDEEEEEEFSGDDDDSQLEDLIDDLEVKFRNLVFKKIGEAEEFFDDANTMRRTCVLKEQANVLHSITPVDNNNANQPLARPSQPAWIDRKSVGEGQHLQCVEAGTQTEDETFMTKSSGTLVSNENMSNREESLEPEQARIEIGQLREVRDSLVAQRQQLEVQRKRTDERDEEALKQAECKVYEIEEAIEAIETAIEFKNDIVIGRERKGVVGEANLDSNEEQLVARLESLSIEELRRLLYVYFQKVVELRYSSRRLEKNVEHIESVNEQISRRLVKEHKHLREMDEEYQTRIRLILTSNNPNSAAYHWYRRMDDQLAGARKKQHDLERSLTTLLVRHGYLVNGADYDVKQVVKMLGIENQLAGRGGRRGDGTTSAGARAQAAHNSHTGWHKDNKNSHDGHHLSSRRNGKILSGHELLRVHKEPRDRGAIEGWEQRNMMVPQAAEVRREKGRLIIQPSSGVAAPSHYAAASSSHPQPHHSNHGYK